MTDNMVTMTCMTTKQKFEVENPEVIIMSNGRYAYKAVCPWKGKNDEELTSFKFASKAAYEKYVSSQASDTDVDSNSE